MKFEHLTIVIPVYNESDVIKSTLDKIKELILVPNTVLIVYDTPQDTTIPKVTEYIKNTKATNILLMQNKYGRGALNAIKTGLESSGENPALVTMADLSDDLCKVDKMLELLNSDFDLVCGSRYMKGGKQIGGPWFKKTLSRVAGVSLHYLAGLPTHDITNSFKMYSPQVLKAITIESNGGFELGMEITIKAHFKGFKIAEIPTTWQDRTAGKSNFKLAQWLPRYIKWYIFALKKHWLKK
ncbi:MAG: glycosyltransferase [Candidatus Omnitrophica bacterium]|nr:glycosyltransferase [Candidatus Omnitrophota bacterium]